MGFLLVMVLCALFCYELAQWIPSMMDGLRYVGAAYIVYLAVHVAKSRPDEGEKQAMSFLNGLLLQFVNIKIILYAVTVYIGYVLPYDSWMHTLLIHAVVMTTLGMAGTLTWAASGSIFQKFLVAYYCPFNVVMALVLLWCAASLVFEI